MAWFRSESDIARTKNLRQLEEKRVLFAKRLESEGIKFDQALLTQAGGGFAGIGLIGRQLYYLTGPAPAEHELDFEIDAIESDNVRFEPHIIPSEGGGGMLGFGKKGGRGYKLIVTMDDGSTREAEFVPALQAVLDVRAGQPFPLTDTKRSAKDYNFVWDFKIINSSEMDKITRRWCELLG